MKLLTLVNKVFFDTHYTGYCGDGCCSFRDYDYIELTEGAILHLQYDDQDKEYEVLDEFWEIDGETQKIPAWAIDEAIEDGKVILQD